MIQIKAQKVNKHYIEGMPILTDVSLEIEKGDFVSIIGESGSGKSTLLTILAGIEKPTDGKVFLAEQEITFLKERDLAKLRRTKLSFVYQFFNLAPYLTVYDNIMLPIILDNKKVSDYAEKATGLLSYLKLSDKKDRLPQKLSGGEQQRVAIARGLIFEPEILFLDEPTGNLDKINSLEIMKLLKQINEELGTTIIQVTHSASNAEYGNRVIKIEDGRIVEE